MSHLMIKIPPVGCPTFGVHIKNNDGSFLLTMILAVPKIS